MRRGNATTLRDVAREAGVTAMTVSVVLNGARSATRVSDATRARIEEAAVRLRYRPNAVARGLTRRRMDTLGVVANIDGGDINLYFLEVLNGILASASRNGQNTTVFSIDNWLENEHKILKFCDGRVDGLIFIGPRMTQAFSTLLTRHAPYVTIHGDSRLSLPHNLDVDDEAGALAMVQHLISLGHKRIAHFMGRQAINEPCRRLSGYRRALEEAGLYDESLLFTGIYTTDSGRNNMQKMLASGPLESLPTAIFCGSDAIAYGCMEVLGENGLRAPEDMSVAGYDDLLLARMTSPHLATVRQPFRAMGERAVELLLSQIAAEGADAAPDPSPAIEETGSIEIFPVELIIRGSVGPPTR